MIAASSLAAFLATEGIEGFHLEAYDDLTGKTLNEGDTPKGKPTIAGGLTKYKDGQAVEPGDAIDLQEAWDEMFHYLHHEVAPSLMRLIKVPLDENQANAFGSFLFNFGEAKAKRYTLTRMINEGADDEAVARQWMKYVFAGGEKMLGLYRRRMAEVLLWMGLDWRAALNVGWDDDVIDVAMQLGYEPEPLEHDLFDEPTAMEVAQHESAKAAGYDGDIEDFIQHRKKVPLGSMVKKVPIESVEYLDNPEPKVKRIEDSERGKGYAKTQAGKELGAAGVIGTGAVAVGAVEPVVAFVDKYPKDTILWVFVILSILGLVYYMYGKWQRDKGEDNAVDLLG